MSGVSKIYIVGVLVLGCQSLSESPDSPSHLLALEKSAIGTIDDPAKRASYEALIISDPKSGQIPRGIKLREYRFSQTLRPSRLANTRQTQDGWDQRGPFNVGGRTRALAIDVTNEDVFLAGGTSGGMWRTEDAGASWSKSTHPLNLHSATCIAQDTRAGQTNVWYYGTGELRGNTARSGPSAPFRGDGIFKSTDGGRTWDILPASSDGLTSKFNTQFRYVWEIVVNHSRSDIDEVFAATYGGVVRSQDGRISWEVVLGDALLNLPDTTNLNNQAGARLTDVVITEDGILYATLDLDSSPKGGIYKSSNGANWVDITPDNFPAEFRRTEIGPSFSNPNIVYFLSDADPAQIWRYDDSGIGLKWTDLSQNVPAFDHQVGDFDAQNSYNLLVRVHPSNPEIVFVGGTNLYRSTDGFTTSENTAWVGGYNPDAEGIDNFPGHHPDQHVLRFFPSNSSRSLSAHDGGISVTENNLAEQIRWSDLNNGFVTSQFYAVNLDQSAVNNLVIGGMQDNGSQATTSTNFFSDWQRILGADGGYCAVAGAGSYFYFSFQDSQIFRVRLNNQFLITDFARVDPVGGGDSPGQGYLFINPFELDPINNNVMYLTGGNIVWRNSNLSQIPTGSRNPTILNWTKLDRTEIMLGQISSISVSRTPPHVVYFGTTQGQVMKITEANRPDYQVRDISAAEFPQNGYVASIAVSKADANQLIVVFSNYNVQSLFFSLDGGNGFQAVSGNLEENSDGSGNGPSIRWAEIIPMNDGGFTYLVATSTGLYLTRQLEGVNTIWTPEGEETIGNVVVPMVRYRSLDGMVVAGTHGNGVYTRKFNQVLPLEELPIAPIVELGQNYPNPFDQLTTIPFNVPEDGIARVKIYDPLGREVKTLLLATQFAGRGEITWDGTNVNGVTVSDGIYIYNLEYTPSSSDDRNVARRARKMILRR